LFRSATSRKNAGFSADVCCLASMKRYPCKR
jgi:hypothetical protein